MMDLIFQKGTEMVAIRIQGHSLYFSKVQGAWVKYSGIEGLKFSISGILEEFPDLAGKPEGEIRTEGAKRFKEHIKKMETEIEIKDYLQKDLTKHGYKLKIIKRKGFRPQVIK